MTGGKRAFNGNSEPFNGAEDGVPFEKGESGNPDGRPSEHGLYQSDDKFFDEHPDVREMRDELIESLLEDCKHPDRQEHIVRRYATLFTKLEYAHSQLGEIDESSTWDKLGALETKTQRWLDRIDWEEPESSEQDDASPEDLFFEALEGRADDSKESENGDRAEDLFE